MASYTASSFNQIHDRQSYSLENIDTQIWHSLKMAIAASSGFKRWEMEHPIEDNSTDASLDRRVSSHLRETLEMLAY